MGEVTDGKGGIEWVSAYQWSIDHALRASSGNGALGIGLRVASSKTNQYGQRDEKFVVLRGTEGENMLVDGMSVWAVFADYHGPDMFFSRTSPSSHHARKRLNTGMVNKGVKRCAGRRGLDE